MSVTVLTESNFKEFVAEGVCLVDFWAPWCGPCRMIAPSVEELASEMTQVKFGKLNVDEARNLAMEFNVMSIPTLIIFKDGQAVDTSIGVIPKNNIKAKLEQHL